ncbi:hypothetical protein PoB_005553700 [Plakobranchus ocellatus]|uniref:Uncharacterized protein n=1 Tax=Plakobranchus ocellatus TaxID=259542 RepID=A0AAV4CCG0_9GAST|nr:hypothetical protein PoB_005553700 [Plakobranchus ocellatus]
MQNLLEMINKRLAKHPYNQNISMNEHTQLKALEILEYGKTKRSSTSLKQGDLRLLGPPSGQGAGGGARTRVRRGPADLRADSLATVPPTPAPQ